MGPGTPTPVKRAAATETEGRQISQMSVRGGKVNYEQDLWKIWVKACKKPTTSTNQNMILYITEATFENISLTFPPTISPYTITKMTLLIAISTAIDVPIDTSSCNITHNMINIFSNSWAISFQSLINLYFLGNEFHFLATSLDLSAHLIFFMIEVDLLWTSSHIINSTHLSTAAVCKHFIWNVLIYWFV